MGLEPSSKADFAFVQHMIYQLADNGTIAVVLSHGALYRGGAEGSIREYIIKELNYLDAVIGLPPNLFYGTSIPACILVLKKCRVHDDNIIFIDASAEFEKAPNQSILTDTHVNKIVDTYSNRKDVDRYAHVAPLAEVGLNDFNLHIPRYVQNCDEEDPIDIEFVSRDLQAAERRVIEIDQTLSKLCGELQISPPFGHNIELLKAYKKGVMASLFSRSLRFKSELGQEFPEWTEKHLGGVFGWVRTNSLSREYLVEEGDGIQNIHYGDIHKKFKPNFRQDREKVPYIAPSANFKVRSQEEFCRLGDVVIADASEDFADIGKSIEIVQARANSLVAGLHTFIARPKDGSIALGFAGYLLRSPAMRKQIVRIAQGISVLGVSKRNLEKVLLDIPHTDEQQKIANFLSAFNEAIDEKIMLISEKVQPGFDALDLSINSFK